MTIFVICDEYVDNAAKETRYAFDFLFEFLKSGPQRVAFDLENKIVLKKYNLAVRNSGSQVLKIWIKGLFACQSQNVEFISIEGDVNDENVFPLLAASMPEPKQFVVWSLDRYKNVEISRDVRVIDRSVAVELFRPAVQGDKTMSDKPNTIHGLNIHGGTVFIQSSFDGALVRISGQGKAEAGRALSDIANMIEVSGNREAGDLFDKFNREIASENPDKKAAENYLKKIFDLIPDVAKIADSARKILDLFF